MKATTQTLKIAPDLELPLEMVTQTMAVLAKRGVGKTHTAVVMVEEMLKNQLHVVICDPVGVWWGIRSSKDGTRKGHAVFIFGGEHGDVPLEATAGRLVAQTIIETRIPALIDLSLFSKKDQTRFMADFCETLYRKNRQPLHLVLDEADAFAPQKPMHGQERMLGAVDDIVRRGRARGLGVTLITQRAAVINKDVLTQTEVMVSLRMLSPQDRKAADEWIKAHGTEAERRVFMESLASLPIGTAWVWSPGWLDIFQKVQIRDRETFDSSATPKVGGKSAKPTEAATIDVEKIRGQLQDLIDKAAAEREEPTRLKTENAQLKRQLQAAGIADPELEAKLRAHIRDLEAHIARMRTRIDTDQKRLAEQATRLESARLLISNTIESVWEIVEPAPGPATPPAPPRPAPPARAVAAPASTDQDQPAGESLPPGSVKLVEVFVRLHPRALSMEAAAIAAGQSIRSSQFRPNTKALRDARFVYEAKPGAFCATDTAMATFGANLPPPPADPLEMWSSRFTPATANMLREIVSAHPQALDAGTIADRAGVSRTSSTVGGSLRQLVINGLVSKTSDNEYTATEVLL